MTSLQQAAIKTVASQWLEKVVFLDRPQELMLSACDQMSQRNNIEAERTSDQLSSSVTVTVCGKETNTDSAPHLRRLQILSKSPHVKLRQLTGKKRSSPPLCE